MATKKLGQEESIKLEIPSIILEEVMVSIIGVTELITHRFGDIAQSKLEDTQTKVARGPRLARDPYSEYLDSLYIIDSDNDIYGFPALGLKKSLITAGGRFGQETMVRLMGMLNVSGDGGSDLLTIHGSKPRMRRDHVRLSSGVSSLAYRPAFKPWSMNCLVQFNTAIIGMSQLVNLFQLAGFSVGIGDWRPEKRGMYGRFSVNKVESMGTIELGI